MDMAVPGTQMAMEISSEPLHRVELHNNGELSLFFIGTGSAFTKKLNQNNLLVVKGDDHVLVDCGTKCAQSLHEVGLPISKIQNYIITHSHADHIGGLEEVQLSGRYVTRKKPNMIINTEYQEILWERSLRGGSEMSESKPLQFEDLWTPIRPKLDKTFSRQTWEANIGGINFKLPRTKHIPDDAKSWEDSFWSVAVIIDDRILYTSDTRFDPDLLEEYDEHFQLEVIFHDCQLFTAGVHASLNELKTLPLHLKEKTVLMHYGDNWRDFEQEALDAGFHSWAQQSHLYTFQGRKSD